MVLADVQLIRPSWRRAGPCEGENIIYAFVKKGIHAMPCILYSRHVHSSLQCCIVYCSVVHM